MVAGVPLSDGSGHPSLPPRHSFRGTPRRGQRVGRRNGESITYTDTVGGAVGSGVGLGVGGPAFASLRWACEGQGCYPGDCAPALRARAREPSGLRLFVLWKTRYSAAS